MDETVIFTVQWYTARLVHENTILKVNWKRASERTNERVTTRRSDGIEMEAVHTGRPTKKARVTSAVHRGEAFL